MIIIISLIASLAFITHFLTCTHIAQQQYYEYTRYYIYTRNKIEKVDLKKAIIVGSLIAIGIIANIFENDSYLLFVFAFLTVLVINYINYDNKTKIKPLKITARVKRLLAISIIVNFVIIFFILNYINTYNSSLFLVLMLVVYEIWYEYIYIIALLVSYPVEKLVANYYIKKARAKLNEYQPIIVAITGSYGKTTTKQIIASILSQKYHVLFTKESFNTPLGITRTINEELNKFHQVVVLEVGVDKVGSMKKFKRIFTPNAVVITAIGPQHILTFKSINNILKEKTKLIDYMKEDGMAFINGDNAYLKVYENNTRKITRYAIKGESDFTVLDYSYNEKGSNFKIKIDDKVEEFYTPLIGKHILEDVVGAICVGLYFNVSVEQINKVVASLTPAKHRMEVKKDGVWTIIDDSYNSNVEGFNNALEVIKSFNGKRVLITPCLVELGTHRVSILHELAHKASKCVDEIILINKEQTRPFMDGLIENGFNLSNIHLFDKFIEGYEYLKSKYKDEAINVLIANDLPDYVI